MALADDLREKLELVQAELAANSSQWLGVALVSFLLLRAGLVLFACALPVMAYMYLSSQKQEEDGGSNEQAGDADAGRDRGAGDPWQGEDEDDDLGFRPPGPRRGGADDDEVDPYGESFWGDKPQPKNAGNGGDAGKDDLDADDILGGKGGPGPRPLKPMDDLDDILGDFGGGMGSGGGFGLGGGGGLDDDFDFLGGGGGGMDFMGGGKSKGKGKFKDDKGKGKDPMAPREPNPKQVFVANVGELEEDEIQTIFEDVGEVDRMKVLRNEDGSSKGVCFVTFRTEEQAQDALKLHGRAIEGLPFGKTLVVRLAHGGNKGEKGEKGDKGGFKGDRPQRDRRDDDRGPVDLGGAERFGAAFGFGRDREERGDGGGFGGKGGGKGGKGKKGGRMDRGEMDDILEEALADAGDGPLRAGDFDFAARRFLAELKSRDKADGTCRLQDALDMVLKYTSTKDRSSVRKWPAYVFTLLQKFDPSLWEVLRERDAARRAATSEARPKMPEDD